MKYLSLIRAVRATEQMPEPDARKHFEAYKRFIGARRESGHFVCNRLLPHHRVTTTVRVRQSEVLITDGPYAETKA